MQGSLKVDLTSQKLSCINLHEDFKGKTLNEIRYEDYKLLQTHSIPYNIEERLDTVWERNQEEQENNKTIGSTIRTVSKDLLTGTALSLLYKSLR